jgi:ribonucleoside-diphosphate reductase alpha chain
MKLTREEVYEDNLAYFNGSELKADVFLNKYALKDNDGYYRERTPDDMHVRLSDEFFRIEKMYPNPMDYQSIFNSLKNFEYIIPQGSPMAGIGNDFQLMSLSNCFVIGEGEDDADSYGGIMRRDEEIAQLQKRRAGVGIDLSFIRPTDSKVKNAAMTSTGVKPFMDRYSNTTREVAQAGRRGALIESINITHPNAEDFIDAKLEEGKVTGANVSVKITDAFMDAVMKGENFVQQFPIHAEDPEFTQEVDANRIWQKIVDNAWSSAEPGLLYWDTAKREAIPDCYADEGFATRTTNPCGEILLCKNDSCRLMAMNYFGFVENPFTKDAKFDFKLFKNEVKKAQRLMDDLIDLEIEKVNKILEKIDNDPEPEYVKTAERELWTNILDKCKKGRRTGLGETGLGDMLAGLGLTYGTDEANDFAEEVMEAQKLAAYEESVNLARERGAFPIFDFDKEKENPFIQRIAESSPRVYEDMRQYGRRNIALLTIAPTGTVSLMAGLSSGCECAFMISHKRRRKINPQDKNTRTDFIDEVGDHWQEYRVFHDAFFTYLRANGYDVEDVVNNYPKEKIDEIVENSPYHNATTRDVDWVQKVKMQGKLQRHIDHSISVTVNLPEDISVEMVKEVYRTGYEWGCKGMTIYRDGSRSGVLISDESSKESGSEPAIMENHATKRPKKLNADVVRFQNNKESWIGFVGLYDGHPYEIFTGLADEINLPKSITEGEITKVKEENEDGETVKRFHFDYLDENGKQQRVEDISASFNPEYWNYAKMISYSLRHGMPLQFAYDMVKGLDLPETSLHTWKEGVARILKKYIPDGKAYGKCLSGYDDEDCGLQFVEGCLTCPTCGISNC